MRKLGIAATLVAAILVSWVATAPASAQTRVAITSGFEPDPWNTVIELRTRLSSPLRATDSRGAACNGGFDWVDVEVEFTAANLGLPLIFSVGSGVDTTLLVEEPWGDVYCDDDSGALGYNPMVYIQSPRSGRYRVWVGVYRDPATHAVDRYEYGSTARVSISELYSQ